MKLNENYINVPTFDEFEAILEDEDLSLSQEEMQETPIYDLDLVSKCEVEVNRKLAVVQKIYTGPKIEGVSDTFISLAISNMVDIMYQKIRTSGKTDFNVYITSDPDKKFVDQMATFKQKVDKEIDSFVDGPFYYSEGGLVLTTAAELSRIKYMQENYAKEASRVSMNKKLLQYRYEDAMSAFTKYQNQNRSMIKMIRTNAKAQKKK